MVHRSLSTLLLAFLSGPLLFAQGDTTRLNSVSVTATRIPGPLERAGRHLQVIDARTLKDAPRPEVSEILRDQTLVDVRQRGPFDVQTDLGMRGGTFDQVLVLVDGIPMSDPQTGHHLMDLPLLGDGLERVEVLYGGASRTFGAGAFSGAVNLITRRPQGTRGSLTVDGGEFGSWRVRAMQEWTTKGVGFRVSGHHGHSDGFRPNTDFDQSGAHLAIGKAWKRIELRGQGGWAYKRFGAQDFYSSRYPDQQEITTTMIGGLELRHRGTWNWTVRSYFRQHNDRFELFREDEDHYRYSNGYFIRGEADTARFGPTSFYTFHNAHRTRVWGAEAQVSRTWKGGTTALGVHVRQEGIFSNVLGKPLAAPVPVAGSREEYTRSDARTNAAVHVDHRWSKGRLGVDAGVLLNVNSVYTPEWLPGADLHFAWTPSHTSFVSASRAFRLPTYTDLYYNRGGAVGSIDLRPEHGDQVEVGHRYHGHRWRATFAAFARQGHDLIDWVLLPGETTVHAANLTEVSIQGLELDAAWTSSDTLGSMGVLYAYQWSDRKAFDFTSLYVLDQLRHRLVLWGQRRAGAFTLRINAIWQQREGNYARYPDNRTVRYPETLRLDARLSWQRGPVQLFISGYNLLDADQMDRANVPLPGRWLSGGATLTWWH